MYLFLLSLWGKSLSLAITRRSLDTPVTSLTRDYNNFWCCGINQSTRRKPAQEQANSRNKLWTFLLWHNSANRCMWGSSHPDSQLGALWATAAMTVVFPQPGGPSKRICLDVDCSKAFFTSFRKACLKVQFFALRNTKGPIKLWLTVYSRHVYSQM